MYKDLNIELRVDNVVAKLDGHQFIKEIVRILDDDDEGMRKVFEVLAQSNSSEIRTRVAWNDNLSSETVRMLLQDDNIDVLRALVKSRTCKQVATNDDMSRLIDKVGDAELLSTIAGSIEKYVNCDPSWLAEKLVAHKDPCVRMALAENSDTPVHIIKRLAEQDSDADIRSAASHNLEFF